MQSPLSFSSSHSNPTLSPLNILTDFTPPLPLPELERATDEDPRQMNRAHQKQLRAWWSYAFAAECFAAVAMVGVWLCFVFGFLFGGVMERSDGFQEGSSYVVRLYPRHVGTVG